MAEAEHPLLLVRIPTRSPPSDEVRHRRASPSAGSGAAGGAVTASPEAGPGAAAGQRTRGAAWAADGRRGCWRGGDAAWRSAAGMGLCLPCLGGAAEDVVETPDPVSVEPPPPTPPRGAGAPRAPLCKIVAPGDSQVSPSWGFAPILVPPSPRSAEFVDWLSRFVFKASGGLPPSSRLRLAFLPASFSLVPVKCWTKCAGRRNCDRLPTPLVLK